MSAIRLLAMCLLLVGAGDCIAQTWGSVQGYVRDSDTQISLADITILVDGTNFGTATNVEGFYLLRIPTGRHALRFSAVGYTTRIDSVIVSEERLDLDIFLSPRTIEIDEIVVEERSVQDAGVQRISPKEVRNMPSPFKGFQALQVLPGVATNNEMSNQYSVRGGGFNENLIFLNGFEIHMPFRPRQGEQEGLGLLNPELAQRITLYTGGFPVRYGGKISSTLDIQYRRGEKFSGSAYVSLLDAGVTTSASTLSGRLSWLLGARKAQARRFFSTQELKGNYQPDYTDVQGHLVYTVASGQELEITGLWANHTFALDPRGRKTFYGIVSTNPDVPSDLRSVWIDYDNNSFEEDGYSTGMIGLRLKTRLSASFQAEHDMSFFGTRETENFALRGNTIIYDVITDPESQTTLLPRGNARQKDIADNMVGVRTWTGKGRYLLHFPRHAAEGGWFVRQLIFEDKIDESEEVEGRNPEGDIVRFVVSDLQDALTFSERQIGFYVQDALSVLPGSDRLIVTVGVRADYFTFNQEWTVSPRFSARYTASPNLTLTGAGGIYYQAPTYRELRGVPVAGFAIQNTLNRNIRSQQSIQLVTGAELFVPSRRIYLRGEAYWKRLQHLISYTLENVRIEYSGHNDAEGFVYGFDIQARGEFVPGLESWINYGFLVAREQFLPEYSSNGRSGNIARPTDQRHTIALFVQDYIPKDDSWKLHMRALFGSGLPYTPPVPGDRVGNIVLQVPGDRLSARFPEFRRIDFGVTKIIVLVDRVGVELTAELLNIFDMQNTVAYSWIPDATGLWQRVPTRLTPRTFNVRLRTSF